MAIGSLLGLAAAIAERARTAVASPPPPDPGPGAAATGRTAGCAADSGRGTLLALAERNEAVSARAAQVGKKPNILVIFGDDIGQTGLDHRLGHRNGNQAADWFRRERGAAGRAG